MKQINILAAFAAFLPLGVAAGQDQADMKPYPAPQAGQVRMVFQVPALENEADRLVEIMVGKTLTVDCNRAAFEGDLDTRVAQGWGYSFFVLEKAVGPVSTRMACPPGQQKTEAFVVVKGQGFLHRYNSKLPMVTYVPEGFEVRYRIWMAGDEIGRAKPE